MNQPKVSVIIPVYNTEKYLRECLDSVLNQTLKDIEIICVDDASIDSSCQILRSYAERDRRVRLIEKETNGGTLSARRTGTLAAAGKYITYVDPDDYLDLSACETAYREITAKKADILQFTCGVEEHGNDNEAKIALENYLSVKDQRLDAKELQYDLFITRDIATSLWGKIYETSKCKLAYRYTPDIYAVVGEDLFWQFHFSSVAESYVGISTIPLYWYRHGVGITNSNWPDLNKFEQSCKMAKLYEQSAHFAQHVQKDKDLLKCAEALGTRMCEDCVYTWKNWVPEDKKADAFKLLWNYWHALPGLGDVITRVTGKQPAVLLASYMRIPDNFYHLRVRENSAMTTHESAEDVIWYFSCVMGILTLALSNDSDEIKGQEINREYDNMLNVTKHIYETLSPREKEKIVFAREIEDELFKQLVASTIVPVPMCSDPALPNEKNSAPYVARKFTRVSRKLCGGVQCFRDNGMGYTFRRTLYHMGLWRDEENPEYNSRSLLKRFSDCCSEHSSPYTAWRILVKLHLAKDAEIPALIQRLEAAASEKKKL